MIAATFKITDRLGYEKGMQAAILKSWQPFGHQLCIYLAI